VRRALAQEQQERGLCEALDASEDAPVAAVVAAGTRPVPHAIRMYKTLMCKTHM
jgi:hypothetical protein